MINTLPNPVPLAISELRRHIFGVVIIVLLIAVAVAFGIAVSASERALREASARAADRFDIVIGAPGSSAQLVLTTVYLQAAAIPLLADDVLPRLQLDPGVEYAAPIALGDSVDQYPVVGTSKDFVTDGSRIRLVEGRVFATRGEAVIGAAVKLMVGATLQPMHGSAADQLIDEHKHSFKFNVVGRLPKTGTAWDHAILVPIEAVWGIHTGALSGTSNGSQAEAHREQDHSAGELLGPPWTNDDIKGVPAIVVRVKSPVDAYRLRAQYQYRAADKSGGDSGNTGGNTRVNSGSNTFGNTGGNYGGNKSSESSTMAVFPAEVLVELYAVIGDMREVMTAMSFATQLIVLLAVLLVIISALAQRRQSIAVLRAMGAPATFIFALVWIQGFLIIGLGAALGLVFGWGGSVILVNAFASDIGFNITPTISYREWLLAASAVLAGSILATIPSVIVWRQNIATTLR